MRQVITWLVGCGVSVAVTCANPSLAALLRHYDLLRMIGEKRLYPTNRHAIAAFRKEMEQANLVRTGNLAPA